MTTADLDRTLTEAATLLSRSGVFDRGDLVEVPADYYERGEVIARGGMGRISTARDRRSGRIVAIKEVLAEVFSTYPDDERDEVLARFCREAVITARLEHPSIVPVYEIGRFGEAPFFAMKRVTGEPLDGHINAAAGFEERLALLPKITAVAEAIAYAHDRGVIHRDLKPGNVLVGEFGETLVIDWGLAKEIGGPGEGRRDDGAIESSIDETLEGSVLGTPQYMPPEQARGEPVDRRADVYSVGAILYHLLAGQAPYPVVKKRGVNPIADVLRRVRDEPPEPLGALAPETPRDLLSIVEKAMARDPGDRYGNAAELAADLESFQRGQLVAVHDYSAAERIRRWLRRHRAAVLTAAVLVGALIAAGVWFVIENRRARMRAESAIDRWVSMFEQRGREELHHGDIATAALILAETYQQMPDDPGVATLLADALRAVEPLEKVIKTGDSPIFGLTVSPTRLIALTEGGQLLRIDPASGEQLQASAIGGAVLLLAINDDRLALIGDGRITVLDGGGAQLQVINTGLEIVSVGADPSGKLIGVGSTNGEVGIYSLENGEKLGSRDFSFDIAAPSVIYAIAVRSDGSVLVSSALSVSFWESPELTTKRWSVSPRDAFASADISTTRDRAVLGTTGRALLVDINTGKSIAILDGHKGQVLAAFAGDRVITWDQTATRVWNTSDGELVSALRSWSMQTTQIAISPDRSLLAIGGHSGTISIVDLQSGRVRSRLVGHASAIRALDFDLEGRVLASAGFDGVVKLWSVEADLRAEGLVIGGNFHIERSGDRMLTTGTRVPTILWDLSARAEIARLTAAGEPAAMSPGGRLIATREGVFSTADGEPLGAFELPDAVTNLAVSESGVVTVDASETLAIRRLDGRIEREVSFLGSRLVVVYMTSDGRKALLPDLGVVHVVDIETGERQTLTHDVENRKLVAVRPIDEGRVLTATIDRVILWDVDRMAELDRAEPGSPSFAVAPGGSVVALGRTGQIDLWYPGRQTVTVPVPDQSVTSPISFSEDGQRMTTAGPIVRVWELATREPLIERDVGDPRPLDAFLIDGGDTLVTASSSALGFWDISRERRDPEAVRRLVADTVPRDFETGRGVISRPVPAAR